MKRLLLITILGTVVFVGNTTQAKPNLASEEWLSVQVCKIAFKIPPNLKRIPREGVDSCVAEFENQNMLLSIDYGWYGDAARKSDVTLDFKERPLSFGGKVGRLATYVDDSLYAGKHSERKYVAHVFVVVKTIKRQRLPDGILIPRIVVSLTMSVHGRSDRELEIADRIFRSVRFQS